jgi:hypothetical protein
MVLFQVLKTSVNTRAATALMSRSSAAAKGAKRSLASFTQPWRLSSAWTAHLAQSKIQVDIATKAAFNRRAIQVVSHNSGKSLSTVAASFVDSNNSKLTDKQDESKKRKNDDGDSNANKSNDNKSKTASDYFLDNLGKMFFAAIGTIIAMLVRSSLGNNNNTSERERIEETSVLDPLEIDDLRSANGPDFNLQVFKEIVNAVEASFPPGTKEATYEDFVSVVVQTMRNMKGNKFTIQFGHLIDRVVIDLLERQCQGMQSIKDSEEDSSGFGDISGGGVAEKLPLSTLLTTISLALSGTLEERMEALFYIMKHCPETRSEDLLDGEGFSTLKTTPGSDTRKADDAVSEEDLVAMVGSLRDTCQLPPGPQVLKTSQKYPIQEYRRGTGEELFTRARDDSLGASKDSSSKRLYTEQEVETILRSAFVCTWGECYTSKKIKNNAPTS